MTRDKIHRLHEAEFRLLLFAQSKFIVYSYGDSNFKKGMKAAQKGAQLHGKLSYYLSLSDASSETLARG